MPTISWPTLVSAVTADSPRDAALRAKIAWLCHLTRLAAVGWAAWLLIAEAWAWSDPAKIASTVGHYLNTDLGVISAPQFALAFAGVVVAWLACVVVAYCIWRLFGAYLEGHIFTADAAAWMLRIGVAGLIAVLVGLVTRRIGWLVLTSHSELPLRTRMFTMFVVPMDLLQIFFCLFVLAVGRVFKAAVQIADDNASIV